MPYSSKNRTSRTKAEATPSPDIVLTPLGRQHPGNDNRPRVAAAASGSSRPPITSSQWVLRMVAATPPMSSTTFSDSSNHLYCTGKGGGDGRSMRTRNDDQHRKKRIKFVGTDVKDAKHYQNESIKEANMLLYRQRLSTRKDDDSLSVKEKNDRHHAILIGIGLGYTWDQLKELTRPLNVSGCISDNWKILQRPTDSQSDNDLTSSATPAVMTLKTPLDILRHFLDHKIRVQLTNPLSYHRFDDTLVESYNAAHSKLETKQEDIVPFDISSAFPEFRTRLFAEESSNDEHGVIQPTTWSPSRFTEQKLQAAIKKSKSRCANWVDSRQEDFGSIAFCTVDPLLDSLSISNLVRHQDKEGIVIKGVGGARFVSLLGLSGVQINTKVDFNGMKFCLYNGIPPGDNAKFFLDRATTIFRCGRTTCPKNTIIRGSSSQLTRSCCIPQAVDDCAAAWKIWAKGCLIAKRLIELIGKKDYWLTTIYDMDHWNERFVCGDCMDIFPWFEAVKHGGDGGINCTGLSWTLFVNKAFKKGVNSATPSPDASTIKFGCPLFLLTP